MFEEYSAKLNFCLFALALDLFSAEFSIWVDQNIVDKALPFRFVGFALGLALAMLITVKQLRRNSSAFRLFLMLTLSIRLIYTIVELFAVTYFNLINQQDRKLRYRYI